MTEKQQLQIDKIEQEQIVCFGELMSAAMQRIKRDKKIAELEKQQEELEKEKFAALRQIVSRKHVDNPASPNNVTSCINWPGRDDDTVMAVECENFHMAEYPCQNKDCPFYEKQMAFRNAQEMAWRKILEIGDLKKEHVQTTYAFLKKTRAESDDEEWAKIKEILQYLRTKEHW